MFGMTAQSCTIMARYGGKQRWLRNAAEEYQRDASTCWVLQQRRHNLAQARKLPRTHTHTHVFILQVREVGTCSCRATFQSKMTRGKRT